MHNRLTSRLRHYSLLAGSLMGTATAADAQVICRDIVPDVEVGGKVPSSFPHDYSYNLDLNNDGTFDFSFVVSMYSLNAQGGYNFLVKAMAANNPIYNAVFSYSINYVPWALKMNCGDKVPLFNYFYGISFAFFAYRVGNISALNWNNVVDKHIGLRFKSNAGLHYAWLRLDVNTKGQIPNIVIKEWAYELTPGQHIFVCDTGAFCSIAVQADPGPTDAEQQTLQIFPNPATSHTLVRLPQFDGQQALITLTDARGTEVMRLHAQSRNTLPLDINHLPAGFYLITVQTPATSSTVKLIKR